MYIITYIQRCTQSDSLFTAMAGAAINNVAGKCSISWPSFWEFVSYCRTRHEWLHDQSLTCQQAPSSQNLQYIHTETQFKKHTKKIQPGGFHWVYYGLFGRAFLNAVR